MGTFGVFTLALDRLIIEVQLARVHLVSMIGRDRTGPFLIVRILVWV